MANLQCEHTECPKGDWINSPQRGQFMLIFMRSENVSANLEDFSFSMEAKIALAMWLANAI